MKDEHALVRNNFKKILEEKTPLRDVYSQTAAAIMNHFLGEEKLVFPKFESNPETRKLTDNLIEEHSIARRTIKELGSTTATLDNEWLAKAKGLDDILNAHFKVEEDKVFPKAKLMLSDEEQRDIGRRYKNKQF